MMDKILKKGKMLVKNWYKL